MRLLRSFVPVFVVAALLLLGFALDNASANAQPLRCAGPVAGCPNFACQPGPGNCPPGAPPVGAPFTDVAQQSFNYQPCTAVAGAACPNPLIIRIVCFSGGYNLNAQGNCVLVCGWNTTVAAC
jgi:hypothetical protein